MGEGEGRPQFRCCGLGAARGLADLLVEPCGCAGLQACLHAWRLQQLETRGDAQHCDRHRYHVPTEVWRAAALAGVEEWRALRLVQPASAPRHQGGVAEAQPAGAAVQQGARRVLHILGRAAASVGHAGVTTIITFVGAGVCLMVSVLSGASVAPAINLGIAELVALVLSPATAAEASALEAPAEMGTAAVLAMHAQLAAAAVVSRIAAAQFRSRGWDRVVRQSRLWRLAARVAQLAAIPGLLLCTRHLLAAGSSAPGSSTKQPSKAALTACLTLVRLVLAVNVSVVHMLSVLAAAWLGFSLVTADAAGMASTQTMTALELLDHIMQALEARRKWRTQLHTLLAGLPPRVLPRAMRWCAKRVGMPLLAAGLQWLQL